MAELSDRPSICVKAVISLVLGLASVVGGILTGAPAIWLGLSGLREINQSEGRLRGRIPALTGMLLGALACAIFVIGSMLLLHLHYMSKAARENCGDHLMHVGRAVVLYHNDRQPEVLPMGTIRNERLPPEQRLSWLVSLLPYLNNEKLHDRFDLDKGWNEEANLPAATTTVPRFHCPSNPTHATPGAPAFTHYVGLAGFGRDAATLPAKDRRTGFFGYDREIRPADVTRGTSHTMMVTETTADNGPWAAGGSPTVRAVDPASQPYFGPGRPFGGLHRDGFNILWADGHVMFASHKMSPLAFEEQVRIHAPLRIRPPRTR